MGILAAGQVIIVHFLFPIRAHPRNPRLNHSTFHLHFPCAPCYNLPAVSARVAAIAALLKFVGLTR